MKHIHVGNMVRPTHSPDRFLGEVIRVSQTESGGTILWDNEDYPTNIYWSREYLDFVANSHSELVAKILGEDYE